MTFPIRRHSRFQRSSGNIPNAVDTNNLQDKAKSSLKRVPCKLLVLTVVTICSVLRTSYYSYLDMIQAFPVPSEPRGGAAICAIQKGAKRYLDEWTDYHLALGFDRIYLYDNSDDFELKEWAQNKDSIHVKHYPGLQKQMIAYTECGQWIQYHKMHSWIAFMDTDEFVVIRDTNKFPYIMDFLVGKMDLVVR